MVTKRARKRTANGDSDTKTAATDLKALVEDHGYRAGEGHERCFLRNQYNSQCLLERGHGEKGPDAEPSPHVFRGVDGELTASH